MSDRSQLRVDLLHGDVKQRSTAAEQLCHAGEEAAFAAVELVQATGDVESVSSWAVSALEEMGAPPAELLDPLAGLANSSQPVIAYWAVTLLGRLGNVGRRSESTLAAVVDQTQDLQVRARAAWALGEINATSEAAITALTEAAKSSDARLARLAGQALSKIDQGNAAERAS